MNSEPMPAVPPGLRPAQRTPDATALAVQNGASALPRERRLSLKVMSTIRWLHIYLSMFGFTALVFFAVTGITLNHAAWFGLETESIQDLTGTLDRKLLTLNANSGVNESTAAKTQSSTTIAESPDSDGVDRLLVVESLRQAHGLSGAVAEFRTDETECFVSLKGPGFSADAFINRDSGEYQLSVSRLGLVAVMNDLHKGRDSGAAWSLVIDISAVLMTLSAITGMLLLVYLKRIRFSGFVTAIAGTALLFAVFRWLVP